MGETAAVVLDLRGVEKDYRGLRPLRIQRLQLHAGEHLALAGFDGTTAEVMVNLVTGATVPDAGEIRVFGELTSAIANGDAWLASLDRFGILSDRAVLLDGLSVLQNLAMPLSLELDPIPEAHRAQALALAAEVGLGEDTLDQPAGHLTPQARVRLRLGRALALKPSLLLAEHPNAPLPAADVAGLATDLKRIVAARRIAGLTLTADAAFAAAVGDRMLTLHPASGELRPSAGWRRWFAGR